MKRQFKVGVFKKHNTKLEKKLSASNPPETSRIDPDGAAQAQSARAMLDHISGQCDQLSGHIDLINESIDSREVRLEIHLSLIEAEILEMHTLIGNRMRAGLREISDTD